MWFPINKQQPTNLWSTNNLGSYNKKQLILGTIQDQDLEN